MAIEVTIQNTGTCRATVQTWIMPFKSSPQAQDEKHLAPGQTLVYILKANQYLIVEEHFP